MPNQFDFNMGDVFNAQSKMSSSNRDALAKIIVEGDSIQIVRTLAQEGKFAQEGKSYSDCCSILSNCLELLPLFSFCSFIQFKRSCNMVAHAFKRSPLGARLVFS